MNLKAEQSWIGRTIPGDADGAKLAEIPPRTFGVCAIHKPIKTPTGWKCSHCGVPL
jgi:hypothetical protein